METHVSKRHPLGDARTGPEAAAIYLARHPGIGLRQVGRFLRIEAGLRPLQYDVPGKREIKTGARIAARHV